MSIYGYSGLYIETEVQSQTVKINNYGVCSVSCVLCECSLPITTQRRRLHSVSSSIAFQSLSSELGLEAIIPIPYAVPSAGGPFLCVCCVCCFKSLEKYAKVKASLNQLDTELKNKIKSVAATLDLSVNSETSFSIPG